MVIIYYQEASNDVWINLSVLPSIGIISFTNVLIMLKNSNQLLDIQNHDMIHFDCHAIAMKIKFRIKLDTIRWKI